jgi:signal peptidase I
LKYLIGKLGFLLLVVIALIGGASFIMSHPSHTVGITVDTNGTSVTIKSSSFFLPEAMLDEMKEKALIDVQEVDSSVGSIQTDMQEIARKYNYTVNVKVSSQFGENQLPMPATVKGTSMLPTLKNGQEIIVLKTNDFKVGDLVVAKHPEYDLIVKRVAEINGSQVYLKSDNRQVQIVSNKVQVINGVKRVVTIEKRSLDVWLPRSYVVGVVKEY